MPTAGWWEALWSDPAKVLNQVGIRAGMTVIDLCSGDGWFTLQIAKVARRIVAVDIDAKLLDVAKLPAVGTAPLVLASPQRLLSKPDTDQLTEITGFILAHCKSNTVSTGQFANLGTI